MALPPLFKGRTDAGALVELRPVSDGYDIFVDGARSDHTNVPWHLDPDAGGPVLIGEHRCDEIFDASVVAAKRCIRHLAYRAEQAGL